MGNIFDSMRDSAFDTTTKVMGYDATWLPSTADEDSEPLTARVHFKSPDQAQEMSGIDYMPLTPFMEYRSPFLPNLYELVQENNGGERVTINGVIYYVRKVVRLHDGATYMATLEINNEPL